MVFGCGLGLLAGSVAQGAAGIRIKDLGRVDGVRDNVIVGYGIVTGLAGTGDSQRSRATFQSVANILRDFGVVVDPKQLSTRNAAAVRVTATLPAFARAGDKIDVNVASMGDARSLLGGTLLMSALYGPDKNIYALAQGPLSVGGFKFDMNGNVVQKNHPTAGVIPEGATVERSVPTRILNENGEIALVLFNPDYTTASRMASAVNSGFGSPIAQAIDAGRIRIAPSEDARTNLVDFVARVENVSIEPDQRAKVVVNERTGTVVAGGDVRLSQVSVTHGNLRVSIVTDYLVSQPEGVLVEPGAGVRTRVVPQTRIDVSEDKGGSISMPAGTTVSNLVIALNQIKTNPRDIITILQSIKRSGALHAELIIQ